MSLVPCSLIARDGVGGGLLWESAWGHCTNVYQGQSTETQKRFIVVGRFRHVWELLMRLCVMILQAVAGWGLPSMNVRMLWGVNSVGRIPRPRAAVLMCLPALSVGLAALHESASSLLLVPWVHCASKGCASVLHFPQETTHAGACLAATTHTTCAVVQAVCAAAAEQLCRTGLQGLPSLSAFVGTGPEVSGWTFLFEGAVVRCMSAT